MRSTEILYVIGCSKVKGLHSGSFIPSCRLSQPVAAPPPLMVRHYQADLFFFYAPRFPTENGSRHPAVSYFWSPFFPSAAASFFVRQAARPVPTGFVKEPKHLQEWSEHPLGSSRRRMMGCCHWLRRPTSSLHLGERRGARLQPSLCSNWFWLLRVSRKMSGFDARFIAKNKC